LDFERASPPPKPVKNPPQPSTAPKKRKNLQDQISEISEKERITRVNLAKAALAGRTEREKLKQKSILEGKRMKLEHERQESALRRKHKLDLLEKRMQLQQLTMIQGGFGQQLMLGNSSSGHPSSSGISSVTVPQLSLPSSISSSVSSLAGQLSLPSSISSSNSLASLGLDDSLDPSWSLTFNNPDLH
jgi:hypothetical protein